jgi:hypothetical protein
MSDACTPLTAAFRGAGLVATVTLSGALTGWLAGRAATSLSGTTTASWLLGRAAGITAYTLLVVLVLLGLVMAHPWARRLRYPSPAVRLRLHVALAAFAAAFTVLHIVVLAADEHAGVGWAGAVLPLASDYRPVPVTLGIVGLYAGLVAGLTAALAGRMAGRVWLPLHRFAGLSLVLVWGHGVLAGTDTGLLLLMYLGSGALVLVVAASRYAAPPRSMSTFGKLGGLPNLSNVDIDHEVRGREVAR